MKETDLYAPVKAFLEAQGFTVKGEVGAADVVALREDDPAPLVVELKQAFSLKLLHQAVARLSLTDAVYVCVARPRSYKALRANIALCRRLGLGVLTVRPSDGRLEVHAEPGPYAPRKSRRKQARLLSEFRRRAGDPNDGGASTRQRRVTSYRQDALRCARFLADHGASRGAAVKAGTEVATATRLMADNHYGWFQRVERGVYDVTDEGRAALVEWADALEAR